MDPSKMPAVDLSVLKGGNREKQAEALEQRLKTEGVICQCGKPIKTGGVKLFGVWSGLVPTPNGPQDAAMSATAAFCGDDCERFKEALADGIVTDAGFGPITVNVVGHFPMPTVTWLIEERAPAVQTAADKGT